MRNTISSKRRAHWSLDNDKWMIILTMMPCIKGIDIIQNVFLGLLTYIGTERCLIDDKKQYCIDKKTDA